MPTTRRRVRRSAGTSFVNPYPQMSAVEARVHLFLEGLGVPFSWRNFDGASQAPNFTWLMPSFAPEFTLTEYKAVILIVGSYWGSVPGILDTNGLATALLEQDGWKVAILWEQDILRDVYQAVLSQLPQLSGAPIKGGPKTTPWTYPRTYLDRLREYASRLSFKRKILARPGDWSQRVPGKRKPLRSTKRDDRRIKKFTVPEDTTATGKSRLNGKAPDPNRAWRSKFRSKEFFSS